MNERIVQAYQQGKKIAEIAAEFGVNRTRIYTAIKESGIELRCPQKKKRDGSKSVKADYKVCPHCKTKANPTKARFCCMCGADIRSEADIILPKLENALMACSNFLPANTVGEVTEAIRAAMAYIRQHD